MVYIKIGILLLTAVFSFFVSVIIHELGHLIFGLLGGYTFKTIYVGPFTILRQDGKIKIKFEKNASPIRGGIDLIIKERGEKFRRATIIMLLGGPIISLLFSFGTIAGYIYLNGDMLLLLAVTSFFMGVGTLLPLKKRSGSQYTDGKRALELWRNGKHGKNEYAYCFLYQCYIQNVEKDNEELHKQLLYMLNHQLKHDVIYPTFAIFYILEKQIDILDYTKIQEQLQLLYRSATVMEKKWMHLAVDGVLPPGMALDEKE